MYYLIVGVGRTEQVLCTGSHGELEALARKLRKGAFFRWVRVDKKPPATARGPYQRQFKPRKP